MAIKNRTNLIKEFLKEKNNNLIILTTYSFDPVFFDYFLFPKLAENNPFAEVLVFVDGYTYQQTYPKFTPKTGTEYRLIPVYQENGVFHPKIGIFYSREKDRANLFIGSANLTLAGFTRNAEIVLQIEFTPAKGSPFFRDLLELFLKLFESNRCIDSEVHRLMKNVYVELSEGGSPEHSEIRMFHNLTEPILDQICSAMKGKKFSRMRVIAPFFSSNAKNLFMQIRDRLGVKEIIIGVQKKNNNLEPEAVSRYLELAKELGLRLEFREVVLRKKNEKNRRIHAKLIQLDGTDGCFLVVGSPNFTEPALLSASQNGNLETAVLLGKDFENIINEIQFKELQFSDDFWSKSADHEEKGKRLLKVYSAEYDEIDRKLLIHLEPITCRFSCKVRYTNNEEEELDYNAPESRITITLKKQSNPKEVIIKAEDGRSAVIRIYSADTFKRIVRGGKRPTIREVLRVIESRQSIDLNEILFLLNRLTLIEDESSDTSVKKDDNSDKPSRDRVFEPPRRSLGSTSLESIVGMLKKTVERFLKTKTEQIEEETEIQDIDEGDVDKENEKRERKLILVDPTKYKDYRKDILRYIEKLWEQLRSKDSNQNIEIATILTEIVLRILLREYDEKFFMKFESMLDERLENLDTSNIDSRTLKGFFLSLLKLHYISNYTINKIFIRDLFDCKIFTDPKIFDEIKSKFVEFIESTKDFGEVFDEEKFMTIYGNLIASTFSPRSVGEGVRTLVKNLLYNDNKDVRKISCYVLLSFLKDVPFSSRVKESAKEEIIEILEAGKLEEDVAKLLKDIVQIK